MSSRSASALLDAALAVPFDPEEEDRRQLALARSASWDSGPVSPSVVDIAPEPAFVPDPLVQAADQQMQRTAEPAVPTGEYMEPPLPQADEDLPPVSQPGAGGMEQGVTRQGGGRRSASALLADIPEPTEGQAQAAPRRSASVLLADVPEDSSALRKAADVPIFLMQGATTGLKALADVFGADSPASREFAERQAFWQSQLSPEAQASQQRVAQIQAEAADQGLMAQLGAAGRAFVESPTAFVAQGLGTMAPTVATGGAARLVGAGAAGVQAAQIATGAAMGGGIVKGEIYQAVEQAMLQAGRSPEEAAEAASTAQAYGGENLDQILAGYGLGALASAIGAERLAGRAIAGASGPTGGVLRVAGRTALQEGLPEAAQGSQEQLARNLAQQREDFNVPTMRGVVGAGALEGLAGLAIGGPAGVAAGVGAAAGRRTAGPAVPTEQAAPAATAPVRRVVVEQDDVFGEATTAVVEEPGAGSMEPGAGDERFAPAAAAEQRPAEPAGPTGEDLFGEVEQRGETIVTPAPVAAETAAATGETASGVDEATNQNYGGTNDTGISQAAGGGNAPSTAQSAADFTRSRSQAIRGASPGRKEFAAEFEALLEWGQQQNLVSNSPPVRGRPDSKGREHEVWLDPQRARVFKATYPQQFGLALSADGKATPAQYMERIELNNRFFGDDIRLEQLWNDGGRLRVVTSQPAVEAPAASDADIEAFFADLGFEKVRRGEREFFYNPSEQVIAYDAHRGNVLNDNGKILPIDVGMQRVTPELAAALELPAAATPSAPSNAPAQAKLNIQRKLRPDSGAVDVSILEDIVEYGQTVYRAGMEYATWAAAMVKEFGQGVAQFLRQAFDRIVAAYRDSRFSDTTGAVNVFHGTPHKIPAAEGFKLTKVGTGEGAASYGWGLYFAENEEVADTYRRNLAAKEMTIDGKPIAQTIENYDIFQLVGQFGDDLQRLNAELQKYIVQYKDNPYADIRSAQAIVDAIARATFDPKGQGNTYTVELDVNPEELLDWDSPVRDDIALKIYDLTEGNVSPVPVQRAADGRPKFVLGRRLTGEQTYELLGVSLDRRTPVQIAIQGPASQKQRASEALASVGIKGIRYLDQGSRGASITVQTAQRGVDKWKAQADRNPTQFNKDQLRYAEQALAQAKQQEAEGTFNYVIFDESVIRITAENGQPVAQSQVAAYVNAHRKLSAEAGGIDASVQADLVEFGKVVYRQGMTLAQWSARMVQEFGQKAAKFLANAFKQVVAAYRDSRFADTTGAVGDVRPRQTKPRQLEEKAMRNEALAAETRARLGSEYLPISLNAQAEAAKEWINTNGLDAAKLRIAQLSGEDSVPTPLDFAIGIEAAGRLSAVGDHQGAADIVSTMSHRATGMGQTISTLAMMARLSPEGIVFYGENIIRRYINALPPEAQDRIRALQAEVARLKAELAEAKFDQGSEVIRSGKLGDEKIQDRIKRRQRAKVTADLGPAASGPEVTAETRARVISMNRAVRDVLLGDATRVEATKAIEAILLEQGNLSAAEAAAMAKSIADAFFKLMRETRSRLTNEARTKALPTKARGFEKLLELLRSGKDVSDAEFTGNVAQLLGLPGMTPAMAKELQELARRYERATDPDVRLALAAQMFEMTHELVPADIWAKVRAWAYLAMLFAPKTWIKNILGNQILWVAHIGRDAFISGILDPAMALLTGKRTMSGVYFAKRTRALLTPFEDVRKGYLWSKQENPTFNFRKNLAVGVNHLRSLSKLTSQNKFEVADVRNVGGRIFSSKFMRFWENGLSIALGAGDRAFWMAQFRVSLAQMQAAAEKNGTWSGQPTPEMFEAAYAEAAYSIFQNPNVVSKGLNYIRKGLNWMSTMGRSTEFGLGTGLLAFTQVPGSITLRGLVDWSPLGFIQATYTGMRGILYASSTGRMGAKFDQAAFNKEFTQALLGTGSLYLAGAWLYSLGIITASREDDDDLEAFRRASGTGAYRINVTAMRRALLSGNWFTPQEGELGDLVVPYDWAQPLAITLAAGAELAAQKERTSREELKTGVAKQQSMAATLVKLSGTKSLEELPLLSGLSSFMRAWGYGGPVDAVANTVAGMPAMFVPQVVRQWTQIKDNMQRETSAGDPVKREFMKVLATMPGYSTKFPLKFDTMGQAIERYQYGGNNVFNVMFNPAVAREIKMSPVMQEISRLVDATGQTGMAPKKVERTATINGEKVDLTNNQIAAYQYYLGNFTMSHFTWRMAAPVYARLPDELKAKMLIDDIQDIDAAVKSAVLGHDMRRLTRKQLFLRNALVNSPLGRSVPPR